MSVRNNFLLLLCFLRHTTSTSYHYGTKSYSDLDVILENGVINHLYPGAVAMVGNVDGILYSHATGRYEYDDSSPNVELTTVFDVASVTKVLAGTSAVAILYQKGLISLDWTIASVLGEDFAIHDKQDITVRNCLLHNAGFNPDPSPAYYSTSFGCPNSVDYYPALDFTCADLIYSSLLNETTAPPNDAYVYSDLSFITLAFTVGKVVHDAQIPVTLHSSCSAEPSFAELMLCSYEAYVRQYVFSRSAVSPWLPSLQYLLPEDLYSSAAPTTNDTTYRHTVNQGKVSDSNCYAMGGVSGHAGVFGQIKDIGMFMQYMVSVARSDEVADNGFLNASTVELFTSVYNISQSSRALGWSTNTPLMEDFGFDNSCGTMSNFTFMHIGYTGTCVCGDPATGLWSVILTNRVFPYEGQAGDSTSVKEMYKEFNTAAVATFLS